VNPRVAFQQDLRMALREKRNENMEILLLGDINEALTQESHGISAIAEEFNLQNLMTNRHSASPPATYARGRKCLDFAMGTNLLSLSLERAGYEAFNERIHSDHRAYFLDFSNERLFGSDTQELSKRVPRLLQSRNRQQVTQYIREKHRILSDHNVFERATRLTHLGDRHQYAERIDKDVREASITAEKTLRRFAEPAWSVSLSEARKEASLLSKYVSSMRTSLRMSSRDQAKLLEFMKSLPQTRTEGLQALRLAQAKVKKIVSESYKPRDEEREQRIKELEQSMLAADRKKAKLLRCIRKAEEIKQVFDKLKYVRERQDRRGLTRIKIPLHPDVDPKNCNQWRQLDVPTEIVEHLRRRE
jgi:hypothetical protein